MNAKRTIRANLPAKAVVVALLLTIVRFAVSAAPMLPLKHAWPEYGSASGKGVALDRHFAYVAAGAAGLLVFDVSSTSQLEPVARIALPGSASGVAVAGNYAYVANEGVGHDSNVILAGLHVIDIRQPTDPFQVAFLPTTGPALEGVVSGSHLIIADGGHYSEQGYRDTGVEVIDIREPRAPKRVGRVDTVGRVGALAVSGDLIGVVDGGDSTGGGDAKFLSLVQISAPGGPRRVGQHRLIDFDVGLTLVGDRAYVASPNQLEVIGLVDPAHPRQLGTAWLDVGLWGSTGVAVAGSNAFVLTYTGLAVVDVSNPFAPVQRGWHPGLRGGHPYAPQMSGMALDGSRLYRVIERFATMEHIDRAGALDVLDIAEVNQPRFIASYPVGIDAHGVTLVGSLALIASGYSGLQILDTVDPAKPRLISNYLGPSDSIVHALAVAVAGTTACLLGGNALLGGNGFDTVDISDARQPKALGNYRLGPNEFAGAISAAGDRAYLYVVGLKPQLDIIDLSVPASPRRLLRYSVAAWQDRLPGSPHFAYVPDPEEGWLIQDVSDPANLVSVGGYRSIAACLGSTVVGNHAYSAGGPIYDISDPAHPRSVGWVEPGQANATNQAQRILCSVESHDLHCFDISNPEDTRWLGRYVTGANSRQVALRGTDAFVAAGRFGVQVLDLSQPSSLDPATLQFSRVNQPRWLGDFRVPGFYQEFTFGAGYAVARADEGGLSLVDLSDPMNPRRTGFHFTQNQPVDVSISGHFAYVAEIDEFQGLENTRGRLSIVDLADPTSSRRVGTYELAHYPLAVAVSGKRACLALGAKGLKLVDISDPAMPQLKGEYLTGDYAVDVAVDGEFAFVANGARGLQVIDLSKPPVLRWVGGAATGGAATQVAVNGGRAYLLDLVAGLLTFDVSDPANPRLLKQVAPAPERENFGSVSMTSSGDYVCLIDPAGLRVFDLHDPARPRVIASESLIRPHSAATLRDGYLYWHSYDLGELKVAKLPPFFRSAGPVAQEILLEWEGWGRSWLEASSSLDRPDWKDFGLPGTANRASLPRSSPQRYFRLRQR